jgi:hypothetical protein
VEEGAGYQSLLDGGAKLDWIIARTGKTRRHIEARLRLGKLAEPVQAHIKAKRMPLGAVDWLLQLPAEQQVEVANKMVGRKEKDIERVVKMLLKPAQSQVEQTPIDKAHQEIPKAKKQDDKETIAEAKTLAAHLLQCLRGDSKLLARCADALAKTDYNLAEEAFTRANEFERAIKRNFHVNGKPSSSHAG